MDFSCLFCNHFLLTIWIIVSVEQIYGFYILAIMI